MTPLRPGRSLLAPLLLGAMLLLVAGCSLVPAASGSVSPAASAAASGSVAPGASPGASPAASPSASPHPSSLPSGAKPLEPAKPGENPIDLLAFLFTPIFWVLFNLLVILDKLTGNIAIAIILMTLIIRALLIVPFRSQIVSQRRMQLLQPELKELQKRFKGDRNKLLSAQQQFYRERGVSPTSGCLPLLLQFALLIPMYTVISQGLQNYNPQAMTFVPLNCPAAPILDPTGQHVTNPCLNATVWGINWGLPSTLFAVFGIGISLLALVSAGLQLIQSRMTLPPPDPTNSDPNVRLQRQMVLFIPLISILYGGILPAGLFLYWIFGTIFSIVQQYLIIGWGSMFPVFGWHPEWAKQHQPRFPVAIPPVVPQAGQQPISPSVDRAVSAQATIRSRQRGRQGRRGRRR